MYFFFLKKKKPSPKKNVRLEKNIPVKKRRVLERVRLEKKIKNRALTIEKKGKIETEYSQIETVRLGFFLIFFKNLFFCRQPLEVEQWWRSNGGGDRERET